jgi:spermidine/putrescine transport system permease protein
MTVATGLGAGATAVARPAARRGAPLRWRRNLGARAFVAAVLVFLFAPLAVVVVFSFNSTPRMSLPLAGLSLRWYQGLFDDAEVRQAMLRSLVAAFSTAVVAGPLGVLTALGLQRLAPRTRGGLTTALLLPIAVPGLLLAVALAIYFRQVIGVNYSLADAVAGHILLALPFVILTMNAAVAGFRWSLLEAARDLGASPWHAFRTITFPLIRPAVEGAMLLSAAISLDEFIVTLFTAGRDTTLPLIVWSRIQRTIDPGINALATTLLVGTTVLALLAARRTTVRL